MVSLWILVRNRMSPHLDRRLASAITCGFFHLLPGSFSIAIGGSL